MIKKLYLSITSIFLILFTGCYDDNILNPDPSAIAQSITIDEDTSHSITLSANNAKESSIAYHVESNSTYGTLSGTAPNLTYTPNANYSGSDGFTFFVSDGNFTSDLVTVDITINEINDAPTADDQSLKIDEDTVRSITLIGNDVDGNAITYHVESNSTHGTLSGTAPSLIYTPEPNFAGNDSFTFRVSDGNTTSSSKTIRIVVDEVNDLPTADDQFIIMDEDTQKSIVLRGNDIDGDITYKIESDPTHGELYGTAPNLTYIPNTNYSGSDSFTFSVSDGTDDSEFATVNIAIYEVNDAPVADGDYVSMNENTVKTITLNGSDVDGDSITYHVVSDPNNGALSGSGSNRTYTPKRDYSGNDRFTFRVDDGTAYSSTVTVNINIRDNTPIPSNQREILMNLYNNTNGGSWNQNTNWGSGDPCTNNWYGIVCCKNNKYTSNDGTGNVVKSCSNNNEVVYIDLDANYLYGNIPAALGNLTSLLEIDLYENQLYGSIPPELGNLTNLTVLELHSSSLTGSIPSSLGNLTNLTDLYLFENQLSGSVPSSVKNLPNVGNRLWLWGTNGPSSTDNPNLNW